MQKNYLPWIVVWIALFFFLPLGVYFLIRKVTVEKHRYVQNGRTLSILGYVCFGFALFYTISLVTGIAETTQPRDNVTSILTLWVIFGAIGALCVYKGQSYVKRGKKFNRYSALIASNNDPMIDNIAAAYPTTYEQAYEDLETMIEYGFFPGATLNPAAREIRFSAAQSSAPSKGESALPQITVLCPNCGAKNKIHAGTVQNCVYCQTPLKAAQTQDA